MCFHGWFSDDCSTANCTEVNNCSDHGTCVSLNECQCNTGFMGPDCSIITIMTSSKSQPQNSSSSLERTKPHATTASGPGIHEASSSSYPTTSGNFDNLDI